MTTQTTATSQHLAAAHELLDGLQASNQATDANPQTKAVTATAHAILVLAEQVAAVRVLMVEEALSRRADGQPAPDDKKSPKKRGWW